MEAYLLTAPWVHLYLIRTQRSSYRKHRWKNYLSLTSSCALPNSIRSLLRRRNSCILYLLCTYLRWHTALVFTYIQIHLFNQRCCVCCRNLVVVWLSHGEVLIYAIAYYYGKLQRDNIETQINACQTPSTYLKKIFLYLLCMRLL